MRLWAQELVKKKKGDYLIKKKKKIFKYNISPNALNAISNQFRHTYYSCKVVQLCFFDEYNYIYIGTYLLLYECFCTTVASILKRPRSITLQLYKFIVWRVLIHKNANVRHLKVKYFIVTITT